MFYESAYRIEGLTGLQDPGQGECGAQARSPEVREQPGPGPAPYLPLRDDAAPRKGEGLRAAALPQPQHPLTALRW